GQKQSCHSEPALSQAERRLRPLQESLGMNAYLFAFAEHSQVFPQIEAIAQFGDGGLSFADLPQSGRGQQPARQGVFAHACARGGEKLEQATVAEKVEIGSVNVMQVLKTVSLLSYTRPAVPEACEAMTVDVGGALSMPPRSQDSGVTRRHQGKCREWNGHPPGREGVPREAPPGHRGGCNSQQQPHIADADVELLQSSHAQFALLQPARVFVSGRHA